MQLMQFELLYDIIVISKETDELVTIVPATSLFFCNGLASVACVKPLVMFPHLLCCVIIMNIFIVFHTWCHHCPYKVGSEYITFTGSMKNIIISCAYLNPVSSYDMDEYDRY